MSDPESHLRRIQWMMLPLGVVGAGIWGFALSAAGALFFGFGAVASFGLWKLHILLVKRMLTPGNTGRAGFVVLSVGKLALIALALAGIMKRYPGEGMPFVTGLLLPIAAILLEALFLAFQKVEQVPEDRPPDPPQDSPEDASHD